MNTDYKTKRYIPANAVLAHDDDGFTAYTIDSDSNYRFRLLCFVGRAVNPTLHVYFKTADERSSYLASYRDRMLKAVADRKASVAQRKTARLAAHSLKLGDILYSSWGYDQTNVNFYQVVRVNGRNTVTVREIHSSIVSGGDGGPTQHVVAVPNSFVDNASGYRSKPLTRRVDGRNNSININSSEWANLWDGKPQYETAAGWGH